MQHLDTDRLAALADETPTAAESQHLASCVVCRRERDAFVALLALALREGSAGLLADVPAEPLTSWDSLAGSLRSEGLLRSAPVATPLAATAATLAPDVEVRPLRRGASSAFWRRAAASVALLVGGAAIGRMTATQGIGSPGGDVPPAIAAAAGDEPSDIPVYGEPGAQLVSNGAQTGGFTGVPEALQALARAQRDYQRAAAYLAENDTSTVGGGGTPQILRARLAALDEVMPKVREALYEAPQDPVLNQYYLATADVRESTLRQLGRAIPSGRQLTGY